MITITYAFEQWLLEDPMRVMEFRFTVTLIMLLISVAVIGILLHVLRNKDREIAALKDRVEKWHEYYRM